MMWLAIGFIALALIGLARALDRYGRAAPRRRPLGNADIVRVILGLDPADLDEMFRLYAERFGPGAARYARRTREKWKAGVVRPNRQTFDRLLVRLPAVMSFDLKCEVLRRLREECCAKADYRLTVTTRDWREALAPLVDGLVERAYAAELPEEVERRLKWLAADDMRAARAILAESQARESRNALELLGREFDEIGRLVEEGGGRAEVTHTLRLPLGTVTLRVKKG